MQLIFLALLATQTQTVAGTVEQADPGTAQIVIATPASPPAGHIVITGPGVHIDQAGSAAREAREVVLRARPSDVVLFQPGADVSVEARSFDGVLWLEPREPIEAPLILDGTVTDVRLREGVVEVDGQTLHAHPRQIASVAPGQSVRVRYAVIGPAAWVGSID